MQKLVAVNQILPALGERPVTALNDRHPTVALIEAALQSELDSLLLEPQGWWFNTYHTRLYPNAQGEIVLPGNTLSATNPKGNRLKGTQRGDRWYNTETRSFIWTEPQDLEIRERWDFEELPETAARLVMYQTLLTSYLKDLGMESVINAWTGYAQDARVAFEAENLRNLQLTTARTRRFRRVDRARRGE